MFSSAPFYVAPLAWIHSRLTVRNAEKEFDSETGVRVE